MEKINLEDKILVMMDNLKQDTGIVKYQKDDTYYNFIRLTIVDSNNAAYIKLIILEKTNLENMKKVQALIQCYLVLLNAIK